MSSVVPESYHCRPRKSDVRMKINVLSVTLLSSPQPQPQIIIQLLENTVGRKNHDRAESRHPNPSTIKVLKLRAHVHPRESTIGQLWKLSADPSFSLHLNMISSINSYTTQTYARLTTDRQRSTG